MIRLWVKRGFKPSNHFNLVRLEIKFKDTLFIGKDQLIIIKFFTGPLMAIINPYKVELKRYLLKFLYIFNWYFLMQLKLVLIIRIKLENVDFVYFVLFPLDLVPNYNGQAHFMLAKNHI